MKKTILFFILFLGSFMVHGQEVGILVKTTFDSFIGWEGNHAGNQRIYIGENRITRTGNYSEEPVTVYDFFYVNDNPTFISCKSTSTGNKNGKDCQVGLDPLYNIPYDKYTFRYAGFNGCIAESEIMGIYIPQPDTNQKCIEDVITLKNGWNWQYKYDDGQWKDFPAQFQEKKSISFKIKDLGGHENKSRIHFHAGYQTQFTNTRSYDIISCSPPLDGDPVAADVKCNNEATGSVTLKFKEELKSNDKFLFNIFFNTNPPQFIKHEFALKDKIINNTFIWNNIGQGSYIIKYQAQSDSDYNTTIGSTAITTNAFTVNNIPQLTFTATDIQPKCNTDKGGIQITATGGTPPYFYILDNEPLANKHQFTSPYSILNLSDGNHSIIIVDSNNCIEK
jgi:hypothetical protein